MSQAFEEYFGDGRGFGVQITYSIEGKPLGTGGEIKNTARLIDGAFLVLNGDTYIQADLWGLIRFHHDKRALATIGLSRVDDPSRSGLVQVDRAGRVVRFIEKGAVTGGCNTVSAGVYVFEPGILGFIPADTSVSLELEVFPRLVEAAAPLCGYMLGGAFVDIGTPEGYWRMWELVELLRRGEFI